MKIHEVPGVLVMEWNDQGKVVVDTWLKYTIKTAEFREAIDVYKRQPIRLHRFASGRSGRALGRIRASHSGGEA